MSTAPVLSTLGVRQSLPWGWCSVMLGDVCETTSGGTPSGSVAGYYNGDIPWVKSSELRDGLIEQTEEHITQAGLSESSAKLFSRGTLLMAMYGATVGRLGILAMQAATNQAVCAIFPKPALDRDFLFYYLLHIRPSLVESSFGGAQPNISQDVIRRLAIPLPPPLYKIASQKHSANIFQRPSGRVLPPKRSLRLSVSL